MVGSGLSNMQRSKAQEDRYGKGGRGVLKKHLTSFSGGYELSRDKTSFFFFFFFFFFYNNFFIYLQHKHYLQNVT